MTHREWTNGHWPTIISKLLGSEWVNKRKHQACPNAPGSKDCYRFSDNNGNGNFFCRCSDGSKSGFDLLQCRLGMDFPSVCKEIEKIIGPKDAGRQQVAKTRSYAEQLNAEAIIVKDSVYLESRGLQVPSGIRWHRAVKYWQENEMIGTWPAMLAPVIGPSGNLIGMHVTYLEDGKKASLQPNRKLFSIGEGVSLSGCACRLFPPAKEMGVAEGVETAIAAAKLFGMPVWAALNTSLLKGFMPPDGTETLWIYGDNDANYAGHEAAYGLAKRLYGKVPNIHVKLPLAHGDWNDVLLASFH